MKKYFIAGLLSVILTALMYFVLFIRYNLSFSTYFVFFVGNIFGLMMDPHFKKPDQFGTPLKWITYTILASFIGGLIFSVIFNYILSNLVEELRFNPFNDYFVYFFFSLISRLFDNLYTHYNKIN